MKKYIIPAIKVKDVEMEALMDTASPLSTLNNEVGSGDQFSKDNMFTEEEGLPKTPNVWDE